MSWCWTFVDLTNQVSMSWTHIGTTNIGMYDAKGQGGLHMVDWGLEFP